MERLPRISAPILLPLMSVFFGVSVWADDPQFHPSRVLVRDNDALLEEVVTP